MKQHRLTDRLFEGIPAGMPETACLLRLVEVTETTDVPTAAISGFDRVRLSLNPEFVARHAATPGRLFMLLMHEIQHVALGHTRKLADRRENFAFDAVINAMLSRRFPEPEFTGLLTSFYPWRFPACLLRPPPGWPVSRKLLDAGRRRRVAWIDAELKSAGRLPARRVASIYRNLYLGPGATVAELAALLPAPPLGVIALLGSHGSSGEENVAEALPGAPRGTAERRTGVGPVTQGARDNERRQRAGDLGGAALEELDAILREVDRQPWLGRGGRFGPGPGDGWGLGGGDRGERVMLRQRPGRGANNRARLRRLIERVADRQLGGSLPRTLPEPQEVLAPLPKPDRRSVVLGALGAKPLLRTVPFPVRSRVRAGDRVHLYLDVSGCMHPWVRPFYRAVLDCRERVHPRVHLFSTQVRDVSFTEMQGGLVRTDQGHDISCVTRHMRRHRIRRACILTCPHVGRPRGADRETLSRAVLGVALLEGPRWRDVGLREVADHHAFLRNEDPS